MSDLDKRGIIIVESVKEAASIASNISESLPPAAGT